MSSLADLGSWGSSFMSTAGSAAAVATSLAGKSYEHSASFIKTSAKAVRESVSDNVPTTNFVGGTTYTFDDPRDRCSRTVKEVQFLAEGAFGAVTKVVESRSGKEYAVKKIKCQEGVQVASTLASAEMEAKILTRIPAHPNIILCLGYTVEPHGNGANTVNLLLELCKGGHLLDYMDRKDGNLSAKEVVEPFIQITEAVRHLHAQNPPIQHRDLKVENVLLGADGNWKLCDFGSCSTEFIPAEELSRKRLMALQEDIDKTVTMLYRPPELADISMNVRKGYVISAQVDMWMLGCILYTLAFFRHPFQDNASVMAITNAKYFIPQDHNLGKSQKLCGLIHWLLAADPQDRPTTAKLLEVLRNIGKCKYEDLQAQMPSSVREKIRKLDIYAARKDTGDVTVEALSSGPKGSPNRDRDRDRDRSAPDRSAQKRPSRGENANHRLDGGGGGGGGGSGFDLAFALAPADAGPQQAAVPPPMPGSQSAPSRQAASPPVADLLAFTDSPPRQQEPSASPASSGFGDLLGFDPSPAPSAAAPAPAAPAQGDLFGADPFGAFAAPAAQVGGGFSTPTYTPQPQGFGSPPIVPQQQHGFTPQAAWQPQGLSPAPAMSQAPAAPSNAGFGFDFADFTSAPPPPPTAPTRARTDPAPATGNLLDF